MVIWGKRRRYIFLLFVKMEKKRGGNGNDESNSNHNLMSGKSQTEVMDLGMLKVGPSTMN